MLAADKEAMAADIKHKVLELRRQELDLYVSRYANLATLASIVWGFSFDGLVELETDDDADSVEYRLVQGFYICAVTAFALAMYVVVVASFTIVHGHRLALQGTTGHSLDRAVAVLSKQYWRFLAAGGGAMLSLMGATACLAWIKFDRATAIAASVLLGCFLCAIVAGLQASYNDLEIRPPSARSESSETGTRGLHLHQSPPASSAVHGDVHLHGAGGADIDLGRLHPCEDGVIEMEEQSKSSPGPLFRIFASKKKKPDR
jgi:hypothetical protein